MEISRWRQPPEFAPRRPRPGRGAGNCRPPRADALVIFFPHPAPPPESGRGQPHSKFPSRSFSLSPLSPSVPTHRSFLESPTLVAMNSNHSFRLLRATFALLVAALSLLPGALRAQVPMLLNYQGRVTVNGTAFAGTGQFKFALVDAAGTTAYWSNDNSLPLTPGTLTGGLQPTAVVSIAVPAGANGASSALLGDTSIAGMTTAIPVTVFSTHSDVRLRVWFSDGTANGSQRLDPDQRIAATGYSAIASTVPDGAISGPKIAAGAVTGANVATGTNGLTGSNLVAGTITSTQLGANSITSTQLTAGAAAANLQGSAQSGVASGGIILSQEANSAGLIAAGYVRIGALNPTPDRWTNLVQNDTPTARFFATAVWTGSEMLIWGGEAAGGNPLNDGARFNPATDSWKAMSSVYAPSARTYHSAVWKGSEMIIWGGREGVFAGGPLLSDGARYNPSTDTWTSLPAFGAPSARYLHTAVWNDTTGDMIIWGGISTVGDGSDGGRFSASTNSWTPLPNLNAPTGRYYHSAVWANARGEMIIWGGIQNDAQQAYLSTGAKFNVLTNAWTPIATADTDPNTPDRRCLHTAVWAPSVGKMLVWGGRDSVDKNTGGIYDATSNAWISITTTGAPSPRRLHTAVWAPEDTSMIVWGGLAGQSTTLGDGSRYFPGSDTWAPLATANAPVARTYHIAVWGAGLSLPEMLVWSGADTSGNVTQINGGRYSPSTNTWSALGTARAPSPRGRHTMIWTGAEAIVWGGTSDGSGSTSGAVSDGSRYSPAANAWTRLPAGAPTPRDLHTAIWTGQEMIIWGGIGFDAAGIGPLALRDGGRYNVSTNQWSTVTTINAPAGRSNHTAVWTGNRMVVWGGGTPDGSALGDGGRYEPVADTWSQISLAGAAGARFQHTAVWTGSEMIAWGGYGTSGVLNTGGRYDPSADQWKSMTTAGAPVGRLVHTAVWTGSEMIVWGGSDAGYFNSGGRYSPTSDSWIATRVDAATTPSVRNYSAAVWTGSEMIIWGGNSPAGALSDGGRYNPVGDSWTALTTTGSPPARYFHTAVWSGTSMLIYGGAAAGNTVDNRIFGHQPTIQLYLYTRP